MTQEIIKARFASLIEVLKLNPNAFAEKLGVASPVLYNILKGRNYPGFELLQKIRERFNINLEWLFTGHGDMFLEQRERALKELESVVLERDNLKTELHKHQLEKEKSINKVYDLIDLHNEVISVLKKENAELKKRIESYESIPPLKP